MAPSSVVRPPPSWNSSGSISSSRCVKSRGSKMRALLERDHLQAGARRLARDHRAAGAGADDDQIAIERRVARDVAAALDHPGRLGSIGPE